MVVIHDGRVVHFDETGLTTDLSGDVVMRQTRGGEDGNLLPTSDRVHPIDSGDSGLNHLLGIDSGPWIDRLTLNEKGERRENANASKDDE